MLEALNLIGIVSGAERPPYRARRQEGRHEQRHSILTALASSPIAISRFATIRNDSLPMRKTKLSAPRRIKIGGKPFWQVTVPAPEGGRIRRTFKDRDDARIYFERSNVQLAEFGAAAMIDDRTRAGCC